MSDRPPENRDCETLRNRGLNFLSKTRAVFNTVYRDVVPEAKPRQLAEGIRELVKQLVRARLTPDSANVYCDQLLDFEGKLLDFITDNRDQIPMQVAYVDDLREDQNIVMGQDLKLKVNTATDIFLSKDEILKVVYVGSELVRLQQREKIIAIEKNQFPPEGFLVLNRQ